MKSPNLAQSVESSLIAPSRIGSCTPGRCRAGSARSAQGHARLGFDLRRPAVKFPGLGRIGSSWSVAGGLVREAAVNVFAAIRDYFASSWPKHQRNGWLAFAIGAVAGKCWSRCGSTPSNWSNSQHWATSAVLWSVPREASHSTRRSNATFRTSLPRNRLFAARICEHAPTQTNAWMLPSLYGEGVGGAVTASFPA
jgi:hypothetical protein